MDDLDVILVQRRAAEAACLGSSPAMTPLGEGSPDPAAAASPTGPAATATTARPAEAAGPAAAGTAAGPAGATATGAAAPPGAAATQTAEAGILGPLESVSLSPPPSVRRQEHPEGASSLLPPPGEGPPGEGPPGPPPSSLPLGSGAPRSKGGVGAVSSEGAPRSVSKQSKSTFASSLLSWGRIQGAPPPKGPPTDGELPPQGPQGSLKEKPSGASTALSRGPQPDGVDSPPSPPLASRLGSIDSDEAQALPPHWRAAAAVPAESVTAAFGVAAAAADQLPTSSKASPSPELNPKQQQHKHQQQQQQLLQQQLSESVLQAIAVRKLQLLPLREWEDEQRARRDEFFRALGEVVDAVDSVLRRSERDHSQILKFLRARAKVDRESARALRHCSGGSTSNRSGSLQQHTSSSISSSSSSTRVSATAAASAAGAADAPAEGALGEGGSRRSRSGSSSVGSFSSPRYDEADGVCCSNRHTETLPCWQELKAAAADSNNNPNTSSCSSSSNNSCGGRDTETPPWLSKAYDQIHQHGDRQHAAVAAPPATVAGASTAASVSHASTTPRVPSTQLRKREPQRLDYLAETAKPATHPLRRRGSSSCGVTGAPERKHSTSSDCSAGAAAPALEEGGNAAVLQQQLFGNAKGSVSSTSWVSGLLEWTRQQALLQDALATFAEKDLLKAHLESLALHYQREGTRELVHLRQLEAAAKRADATSREAWSSYLQLLSCSSEPSSYERQHLQRKKPPCCWLSEHKYRAATKKATEAIRQFMGSALKSLQAFHALETWRCNALSQLLRAFVLKVYSHCSTAIVTLEGLADTLGLSLPGLSGGGGESAAAAASRQCMSLLERLQLSAAVGSPPCLPQQSRGQQERRQQQQQVEPRKTSGPFSFLSDGHGGSPGCTDSRRVTGGEACVELRCEAMQTPSTAFKDSKDFYPLWQILGEEELLHEATPGLVPPPFRCRLLSAAAETLYGASPPPGSRLLLRQGPAQLQVAGLSSIISKWERGTVCLSKSRLLHFFSQSDPDKPLRTVYVGGAEVKRIGSREGAKLDIQLTEKKRRGLFSRSSIVFRVQGTRDCDEWLAVLEMAADDKAFLASAQDIGSNSVVTLEAYDSPSFAFTPIDGAPGARRPSQTRTLYNSSDAAERYGLRHAMPFVVGSEQHQDGERLPSGSMDEVSLDEAAT